MFVAQSRFAVAEEMIEAVRAAFRNRPHEVGAVPGFARMEVSSPADAPSELWLTTYWIDEQSFRSWRRSDGFRRAHGSLPHGLRIVRGSFRLRCFDLICE